MACSNPSYSDKVVDCLGRRIPIPCGRCMNCRINTQKKLVDRMYCAYAAYSTSAFVTFTYDDEHLVYKDGFLNPTLSKEDLHLYLDKISKRLKNVDYQYFCCGEYGDKFSRPHYHAIFFGLDYQLYKSFFEDSWRLGSVKVLPCDSNAFRYVSKYVCKNYNKSDSEYFDVGLIPPFYKMSRGLGWQQFVAHKSDIEKQGFFVLNSRKIFVNRYYFNKLCHYTPKLLLMKESQLSQYERDLSNEAFKFCMSKDEYVLKSIENRENSLISKSLRENSKII